MFKICLSRLAYLTVKLFYKQKVKPVCHNIRSHHIKTLFYHFMEGQLDLDIHNVEELVGKFLAFLQDGIEKKECRHFFVDSVNLLKFVKKNEVETCCQIIKKLHSCDYLMENIFCRNSKNEMIIKDLKRKNTTTKTL